MKRKLVAVIAVSVLLFVFLLLRSYAFISVSSDGMPAGENATYTILNQKDKKSTEIKGRSSFRRLVLRGSYEITARKDGKSYFGVIGTGGFLRTTKVNAKLVGEKARGFVGNSPDACMYKVSGVLMSMVCTDKLENLKIHMPSTANSPTFTKKIQSTVEGYVEGVATTKEGTIVLLNSAKKLTVHTAYLLTGDGQLSGGTILTDLTAEYYSLAKYKDGFIAYDDKGRDIFYYTSINAKPTKISTDGISDSSSLYSIDTQGDFVLLAYTNTNNREEVTINPEGIQTETEQASKTFARSKKTEEKSEVLIYSNGRFRRFDFNTAPTRIRLCGSNKLCLLDDKGTLEIYETAGTKPKYLYSLLGVTDIENIDLGLLVFRKEGVFLFDTASRSGSLNYGSDSSYSFCGIQATDNNYILCLVNKRGDRVALQIDQSKTDQDNIDKKVAQLLQLPGVKNVSVYDKSIFISPDLGELVYDESIKSFNYDPATKKAINDGINSKLVELGIDKSVYRVVNMSE